MSLYHRRSVPASFMALALACALPSVAVADVPTGAPVDGIRCDETEGATFHIHQHLALFAAGKPVTIPEDIGRPALTPCLYWIHTHTTDGIIHVESPKVRTFTLGEVFDVWGQPLSATAAGPARFARGGLRVFLNGRRYTGDPRKIELAQHTDIVLEAGPPYAPPAAFTAWGEN